jgi:DNA polymerase III subunit alpha
MVTEFRDRPLKSGNGRMAFFNLEDATGQIEVVCFSKPFAEFEAVLKGDEPILVSGRLATEGEGESVVRRLHLKEAKEMSKLRSERTKQIVLEVSADVATREQLDALKEVLLRHKGSVSTVLRLKVPQRSRFDAILPARFGVTPSDELLAGLEKLLGAQAVRLQ